MALTSHTISFVFFGTPAFAVTVLEELKQEDLIPSLIVTAPDKRQGRGMHISAPPVKVWGMEHNIPVLQPASLKDTDVHQALEEVRADVFVVVAYGKMLPNALLTIPKHGILNVHPSLLPKYRGPSPIEAQILNDDRETGVTIMQIDRKMDHGPLLAQTQVAIRGYDWPLAAPELEDILAHEGGMLLAYILPRWVAGKVTTTPQDHTQATYCKLITKEDALIDLNDSPYTNFLKIQAYAQWPKAYFFTKRHGKKIRVKITEAEYEDNTLIIKRVIPEGKKEMRYEDL